MGAFRVMVEEMKRGLPRNRKIAVVGWMDGLVVDIIIICFTHQWGSEILHPHAS